MPQKVKNKLRQLRRLGDLTQEQLGEALGVTRHTILAIENGRYEPSIALALKIASYFRLPVEEIFWLDSGKEGK
ncbi:MAG: helix-turn-helix transcriptional regulator [Syntrophomonadaceae bacterium]|nr:helix-turn-helix transcriptional regulator [Syntrophomonadaceae bacterium]